MSEAHHSFCHRDEEPEKKVLYIVGTPIGNLLDLSPRAVHILKNVSLICCEDTRNTKKLLSFFKINNKLISLNQHNINSKIDSILSQLKSGKSIAIVSDAGMPLINDPGDKLVRYVRQNFIDVICIPGPCAALTALVCSGFPCSKFVFYGFLSKNKKDRREVLENIKRSKYPSILYESPKRILKLLDDLQEICGGQREINLARELTKKFERHYGPNIEEVLKIYNNIEPKGEFTLVVNGSEDKKLSRIEDLDNIKKDLLELMKAGLSHSSAANYLAKKHNIAKNKIYNLIINGN